MGLEQRPEQRQEVITSGPKVVRRPNVQFEPHSYEEFSNRPFYVAIDRYTVGRAPVARRIIDNAAGTGAMIERLSEEGKLAPNFEIIAADIDGDALRALKRNLEPIGGRIDVVQASADKLPVPDEWADLMTLCNSIHLIDEAELAFREAHRVLRRGGILIINTAYEKLKGYGDTQSKRVLGLMIADARKSLVEKGYDEEIPSPVDLMRYSAGDLVNMAVIAGFTNISFEPKLVRMDAGDIRAIFSYRDFAAGALPNVPFDLGKETLLPTINPNLARRNIDALNRGWGILIATKAA